MFAFIALLAIVPAVAVMLGPLEFLPTLAIVNCVVIAYGLYRMFGPAEARHAGAH